MTMNGSDKNDDDDGTGDCNISAAIIVLLTQGS